jgi:RHS repeat-associated protein
LKVKSLKSAAKSPQPFGSIVNNFHYTGREWDLETSLYYYRARYYDPATGRLINEDRLAAG